MKKLGLVIDSSFGISKNEADKLGYYYMPIPVDFNGKEYKSGVNIDADFLYRNMDKKSVVKTAAVPMGVMQEVFAKASSECEEVVVLTLSKNLTSGNETAKNVAKEFNNVFVFDSMLITPWTYMMQDPVKKLVEQGDKNKLVEYFEHVQQSINGYVLPKNLVYLKNGGRISALQYRAASLLSIQPIIFSINGSLREKKPEKKRKFHRAAEFVAQRIKEDYDRLTSEGKKVEIVTMNAGPKEDTANHDVLVKAIEDLGLKVGRQTALTPAIIAHVGPGTTAAYCMTLEKE